ncbi:MAG: hypothetical protein IJT18_05280, partial [Oscillospiraceae bacterium]|nr:hypothetical protein [Oscillospiraceae bacterium]
MSEFLKLAYELIARVVYNLTDWIVALVNGFIRLFITGWEEYIEIVSSYWSGFNLLGKLLTVLLCLILIAIPAGLIYLLVRRIVLRVQLKSTKENNSTLYREIGRLNRQVLDLMEEKNKILALKVNAVSGSPVDPTYAGTTALLTEEGAPVGKTAVLEGAVADSIPVPGGVGGGGNVVVVAGAPAGVAAGPVDPLSASAAGAAMPIPGAVMGGGIGGGIGEGAIA